MEGLRALRSSGKRRDGFGNDLQPSRDRVDGLKVALEGNLVETRCKVYREVDVMQDVAKGAIGWIRRSIP